MMTPVITIGASALMLVKFCKGEEIMSGFSSMTGGIKIAGDFDGEYVAEDASPSISGVDAFVFQFDLSTPEASAYFTENPTAETVKAVIQLAYNDGETDGATVPLAIVIQNTYLQ